MTAPSRGRDDATIRGAVVLVVAIVIGLALLWRSGAGDDDTPAADSTTTSTAFDSTTDSDGNTVPPITNTEPGTVDDTQPNELVAVIVFNGTRVGGLAGEYATKVEAAGFENLGADDAAAPADTTTIYAAEGYDREAEAVNEALELDALIAAKPAEPLGPGDDLADIVVVLGADHSGGSTEANGG